MAWTGSQHINPFTYGKWKLYLLEGRTIEFTKLLKAEYCQTGGVVSFFDEQGDLYAAVPWSDVRMLIRDEDE